VREVIRARLARLGPVARDLLAAGAALGAASTLTCFAKRPVWNNVKRCLALDVLLARRILREADVGVSPGAPLQFGHDKIREVVYDDAGETRRRVYHRRALGFLEAEWPSV